MSRRKYSDKEFELLDRLKLENKKLKKQVSSLRKQFARIDLDRYHNLRDIIDKHDKEEREEELRDHEKTLRKIWECWECGTGVLRLFVLNIANGPKYFRKCDTCSHRTKAKALTDEVKKETE